MACTDDCYWRFGSPFAMLRSSLTISVGGVRKVLSVAHVEAINCFTDRGEWMNSLGTKICEKELSWPRKPVSNERYTTRVWKPTPVFRVDGITVDPGAACLEYREWRLCGLCAFQKFCNAFTAVKP
jgi:hypothetical protein